MTLEKVLRLGCIFLLALLAACGDPSGNTPNAPESTPPAAATQLQRPFVVAWTQGSDLYAMEVGADDGPRQLATGGVIRPLLAPDGNHIAFLRGVEGVPDALWIVQLDGTEVRQLVSTRDLLPVTNEGTTIDGADLGVPMIGQMAWYDATTLYFNTLYRQSFGTRTQDDLYRVDVATGEITQILPPGEGGNFSISPDGSAIVIIEAGVYGEREGRISVIDPLASAPEDPAPRELLTFPAVATGAEYRFYPTLHWEGGAPVFRVAVPNADAIYNETLPDAPPVTLWRVAVDGAADRIGEVQASLFGLPAWSDVSNEMVYLQRTNDLSLNEFEIYVTSEDGSNATAYADGRAGAFQGAQWLPGSDRFVYAEGDAGQLWIGEPGEAPRRLPNPDEVIYTPPIGLDDGAWVVFATVSDSGTTEIRYAPTDTQAPSILIAVTGAMLPIVDAVLVGR